MNEEDRRQAKIIAQGIQEAKWQDTKNGCLGCLTLIIIFFVGLILYGWFG